MTDTLGQILEERAASHPADVIYSFLANGEDDEQVLTLGDLYLRSQQAAGAIGRLANPGDRAVLALAPGLEFVTALYGCLLAGVVAVPAVAHSPVSDRSGSGWPRLALDSGAALIVGQRAERSTAIGVPSVSFAELTREPVVERPSFRPGADDLAVLQYSSGSTGDPVGVMLTNANLLANLAALRQALDLEPGASGVIWVPPYHDMGLVGGLLLPLYHGGRVTLMSPRRFVGRPMRWLEALSRTRASHTAAPNFALELCVEATTEDERRGLDLSNLRTLLCGAEPVRAESLRRFAEAFAVAGFRAESLMAAYGLAEHTLVVSATAADQTPAIRSVSATGLGEGRIEPVADRNDTADRLTLVSNGAPVGAVRVEIVDPELEMRQPPRRVGEVWLRGPSVAAGYWNRPHRSEQRFQAHLADSNEGPFLRTGDLGFIDDGELYVTGRLDDLVVVNGRNHNAEQLERTVVAAHPDVRLGDCVVLTTPTAGRQDLVVAIGLRRRIDGHEDIGAAVRSALAATHQVAVRRIVFVSTRAIPRTASGKVRRDHCRRLIETDALTVISEWRSPAERPSRAEVRPKLNGRTNGDTPEPTAIVATRVGRLLGVDPDELDHHAPLGSLGIDSLQLTELLTEAEAELGHVVDREEMSLDATISSLAGQQHDRESTDDQPRAVWPDGRQELEADLDRLPELLALRDRFADLDRAGLVSPFGRPTVRVRGPEIEVHGHRLIDFSSYNYLGLSGSAVVTEAVHAAVDRYGTSASASRIASGERDLHRRLESALARFLGAEAAITFVSGYLTNLTALGHLAGQTDLIVHDASIHNSIVNGARLSGATRRSFPHNDWRALDRLLSSVRRNHRRAIVVVEGLYSMDGDIPDLPSFVEVKDRHGAFLMVDEAHSLGVLGPTGRGVAERFGIDRAAVDIWMGTLSKSLASCGGYLAGSTPFVDYMRHSAPGYVYSVGLSPPDVAAALASIEQIEHEPRLVQTLADRSRLLVDLLGRKGIHVPPGADSAIVPIVIGSSHEAIGASNALMKRGFNVLPIVSPAVEEGAARLRIFVRSDHTPDQIQGLVEALASLTAVQSNGSTGPSS